MPKQFDYAIQTDHVVEISGHTARMVEFHYKNGTTELFTRVSGGLAWPTIEAPAYFCMFAQREKENQHGRRPLVHHFELEDSDGNINSFLKQVCDVAERFHVYATFGNPENVAFLEKANSFQLYMPMKLTGVSNFSYGLEIVKAWFKADALTIMDNSLLKKQLSALRETELREAADRYNAINGLRYVVTGFDDWLDGRPVFGRLDPDSMVG